MIYKYCAVCGQELTEDNRVTIKGYEAVCYECYSDNKPKTVCLDFDGVMAQYDGWKGADHCGEPMQGLESFLMNLKNWANHNWQIIVHTTRNPAVVWNWLADHDLKGWIDDVTNTKVPAIAYIDDRAIQFHGDFEDVYYKLINFQPHWKPRKTL